MEESFWHQRWESNNIAFHQDKPNLLLTKYFKELSLSKGSRVFIPLCGKTLDIAWLLSNGYRVAGVELSEMAIKQLFAELGVEPLVEKIGDLKQYSARDIDIFVGDIFNLSGKTLGQVDAVYDRAALVALPEEMRKRYTAHLMDITVKAPQLLICYDYDQDLMEGPPFSISSEEVNQLYVNSYKLILLESANVSGGLKGIDAVKENVWLLQND